MPNFFRNINIQASLLVSRLIRKAHMTEHLFMIILAIIIGILGGLGAVGIRAMISWMSDLSFPGDGSLLQNIMDMPWYIKILIPAIGGLIVGPVIYFFAPEAKGHGVPEVMQAILLKGGAIRPRVAFVKAFASAVTIGTGGSVGREGPIIQIGASLGSSIGQFFRVPSKRMKTLVGCGAAAGIAAAFNAPVAGALFAVEIILMDFAVAQFSPIVISSVMATVVSHTFEGDFAAFQVPHYTLASPYEIGFYFVLGLLSGLVSYLFIKVLYASEDLWDNKLKIPAYLKATIGGVIIGCIAIVYPEIMGVGYDSINLALNGKEVWELAIVLIFVKIFATSITLGSGGSGGIFAPALFMGAMIGAFFGHFVHLLFPEYTASPGAYALVAMGGMVAGTTRAPITAIIIVFELTKENAIILPLMITCTISMMVSSKLSRESIYTLKLLRRNIKIKERAEVNVMKSLHVKDVYRSRFESIPEDSNFSEVINMIISRKLPYVAVNHKNGDFMGIISLNSIKDFLLTFDRDALKYLIIAGDVVDKDIITCTVNDNCRQVLKWMSMCDYNGLPVMDEKNPKKQIGTIWRKDINDTYQQEMDRIEFTSDLATKITLSNADQDIKFLEGYVITEIPAPKSFIGKSIKELGIRSQYGVDVLSIKNESETGNNIKAIPRADYRIAENDSLILAGEVEKINKIKNID